jgi:hypothetical protein
MKRRGDGAAAVLTDGVPLAFLLTETTTIVTHRRTTVVRLDAARQFIAQTSSRAPRLVRVDGTTATTTAAIAMVSIPVDTLVSTTAALRPGPISATK